MMNHPADKRRPMCGNGGGGGRSFKLQLWNFDVLGIPEVRNAAAGAAASADVVIFSMSGTVPLPEQTVAWVEMWTWLIDGRRHGKADIHDTSGPLVKGCDTHVAASNWAARAMCWGGWHSLDVRVSPNGRVTRSER